MRFAITPLTGIKIIITANPARTDGPAKKNTISYTKVLTGSMIAILVSSSNMKLMYKIISLQDFYISKISMNAQVTLMTTPPPSPFPSNMHIHIFSLLQETSKVQKMVKDSGVCFSLHNPILIIYTIKRNKLTHTIIMSNVKDCGHTMQHGRWL
jgi:hypothetical protein